MEISSTMVTCINISDPLKPVPFRTRMVFDTERPLEVRFEFDLDAPGGYSLWTVGRQLVFDGLDAPLLTGLGDFKCRATSDRLVIQLAAPDCYISTISLPREQVMFVIDEAERVCPLRDACIEPSDEELQAWLAV